MTDKYLDSEGLNYLIDELDKRYKNNNSSSDTSISSTNGKDGKDGFSPTIKTTKITNGTRVTITDVNGDTTVDLLNGTNGTNGKDGINGINGKDGKDGKDGEQGIQGIQGEKGEKGDTGLTGADGKDGVNGTDGKDGINGVDGTDGFSPIIVENANNNDSTYKLDITDINGTFTTPNLKGENGISTGESSSSGASVSSDIYSTEEPIAIGTWIDGKTIYRKVIPIVFSTTTTTNAPVTESFPIGDTITQLVDSRLVKQTAQWTNYGSYGITPSGVKNLTSWTNLKDYSIAYMVTVDTIMITHGYKHDSTKFYAILEYTK